MAEDPVDPNPEPAAPQVVRASTPRRDLRIELGVLRKQLKEASRSLHKRLDLSLAQLLDQTRGEGEKLMTQEMARKLLEEVRALQLKPEKGRRKDLKAIERCLDRALAILLPERS